MQEVRKKNIFSTHRLSATNDRNIWLSIGLFVYAQLFYRFSVGIFASFGWCRLLYPPFSTLVQLLISFFPIFQFFNDSFVFLSVNVDHTYGLHLNCA